MINIFVSNLSSSRTDTFVAFCAHEWVFSLPNYCMSLLCTRIYAKERKRNALFKGLKVSDIIW